MRPVFYIMLFLPMGITNGYAVVSLAYMLSQAGVSVGAIAGLVGLSLLPQTWRAIWAPLVDATLSVRGWYLISAVTSGLLMAATADLPGATYVGPGGLAEMSGHPGVVTSTPLSRDKDAQRRLWELSEETTGIRYP